MISADFKKMLVPLFACLLAVTAAGTVQADFNRTMDYIIDLDYITYGGASFLLLTGTGAIDDSSSLQDAAGRMAALYPEDAMSWNEAVTLGQFSYMIMQVHDIEGGLFYRLLPGPRYALRELRFKRIVQGRSYTGMYFSGERALRILGRVLDREEARYAQN